MASKKSKVISIRLPNEIIEKVQKRIDRRSGLVNMSTYLRERIIYDVSRKHKGRKKK